MLATLALVVYVLAIICSIGSFACWIFEIVTAFQKEESPLLGILSIVLCALGGFIIGWIKHGEWGIKQLMLIWTLCFVGGIVLQLIAIALGGMAAANV